MMRASKTALVLNITWYGHDGDRLVTTQGAHSRVQTIYEPGSFTPLIRVETTTDELNKTQRRSLAEKLAQDAGTALVPELVPLLNRLEAEILRGEVSAQNRQWLAHCGLTPEQMAALVEPEYTPERTVHLYHCDHRGLPLALIGMAGETAWRAEYDEWGNVLDEDNPHNLEQLIRLPGQQYDGETGLYYNRHRYYDPEPGRYITQDPIGLTGGWNLYSYPLNPVIAVDPQGLSEDFSAFTNAPGIQAELSKAMMTEPWYMDASEARILINTLNDMTSWSLAQSDQFFHCTAFCRVSKSRNSNKSNALAMGVGKEVLDHAKNIFGLYGDGKRRSEKVMLLDNIEDLKVNYHGLTCPQDESCSSRCEGNLNPNHEKTKLFLKNKGYLDN